MAADQELDASVRAVLTGAGPVREVKMFGGTGFMLNGNLVAMTSRRGLLVRVGKDRQADALAQLGARPMVMKGRAMDGYIHVDPPALDDRGVRAWLRLAVAFAQAFLAKPERKPHRTKGERK